MIFFKACSKCRGDMYFDRDIYGAFVQCFQCGLIKDATGIDAVESQLAPQMEKKTNAA